jgi:hypothetical protein
MRKPCNTALICNTFAYYTINDLDHCPKTDHENSRKPHNLHKKAKEY